MEGRPCSADDADYADAVYADAVYADAAYADAAYADVDAVRRWQHVRRHDARVHWLRHLRRPVGPRHGRLVTVCWWQHCSASWRSGPLASAARRLRLEATPFALERDNQCPAAAHEAAAGFTAKY